MGVTWYAGKKRNSYSVGWKTYRKQNTGHIENLNVNASVSKRIFEK
jgi:hypothetical protein